MRRLRSPASGRLNRPRFAESGKGLAASDAPRAKEPEKKGAGAMPARPPYDDLTPW